MKVIKILFSRIAMILAALAAEILIFAGLSVWFRGLMPYIELILRLLSVIVTLLIIKNTRHLSSDLMWILIIILFPVPGTAFYLFAGANLLLSKTQRALSDSTKNAHAYCRSNPEVMSELCALSPENRGQFHYISKTAGFPFYRNTGFTYYPLGDTGYPAMLEAMRSAEQFIFLEYFIIKEGEMWDGMLEILKQKAAEGLDVRVMYDDFGSLTSLSFNYAKQLEEAGVKCVPFNRINPILGAIMNHRDHRKIMVIDGRTAFSGGINLSDEYINRITVHGHWKDNVIRITGEAVWSYTVMFLTHWNALRPEDNTFLDFKTEPDPGESDGYICPYGETPLDDEITAQNIYTGILNQANDYCYIMTPYLIIDNELINSLILCAKHGVDVKIITPGVPDKKLVYEVTRSYYRQLLEGGVKIYEYSPGFIHSKVFVSDDEAATVGTVNLDYRSLYLHFENGTYLFGSKRILDVKQDVLDTLAQCREVTHDDCSVGLFRELIRSVLRIFAPMM